MRKPLENYESLYRSEFFVDKSLIIERLNKVINTTDRYICITRPRRFGKSSVADMLGAYYSKAVNSKEKIFDNLKINENATYKQHINKYNVISMSFNKVPDNMDSYKDYITLIQDGIITDKKNTILV
ncbi:MAG: AAA family ATPase [Sarcina sp.]